MLVALTLPPKILICGENVRRQHCARVGSPHLISIHRGVSDEDLGVLEALGLADADLLLQDEALIEERVVHGASGLLDDVDGVEVAAALEAEDGLDGDLCEVLLVLGEDLG